MDYTHYLVSCHDHWLPPFASEQLHWKRSSLSQNHVAPMKPLKKYCSWSTVQSRFSKSCSQEAEMEKLLRSSSTSGSIPSAGQIHVDLFQDNEFHKMVSNVQHVSKLEKSSKLFDTSTSVASIRTSRRPRKKVSFADDKGFSLTSVRVIFDPIPNGIHSINPNTNLEMLDTVTRLVDNFPEFLRCKASFEEKLEKSNVLLGNIVIRGDVISGEIQVRNIAYEKNVYVRYTTCDWSYHSDIKAEYLSLAEPKHQGFDTFIFQFSVQPDLKKESRVEFAICYVACGQTFWDNNGGKNYVVSKVVEKRNAERMKHAKKQVTGNATESVVFSFLHSSFVWTEFVGWKWCLDNGLPYW